MDKRQARLKDAKIKKKSEEARIIENIELNVNLNRIIYNLRCVQV